jgi:hypothetical protein
VSTVPLAVDQTYNECHGELGTLATGGLHPQQHLGNTGDKPYLSSVHFQALHACHILPLKDGLNIWTLTKIAWAEHLWSLANNSNVHMSTQILLYCSCSSIGCNYVSWPFWLCCDYVNWTCHQWFGDMWHIHNTDTWHIHRMWGQQIIKWHMACSQILGSTNS